MVDTVSGVGVIDKTVAILDALAEGPLGLTELAKATGISKPTVHRLCVALIQHGLIRQEGELRSLGPKVNEWAEVETPTSRLLAAAVRPLRLLRDETGESVQLYVAEGSKRRCVAGLESAHGLRTIVEVGALLPLEVGSAGAVLRGERLTKGGWTESVEEREKGVASVSAPVLFGGAVVAAVSVSGPIDRMSRFPGRRFGGAVRRAAASLSRSQA